MAGKGGMGLLLALGAGLGLLAFSSDAKADTTGTAAGGPGPMPGDCFDANMPPDIKAKLQALLVNEQLSPADFEAAAAGTETAGYPMAAACLRQKAKNVKSSKEATVAMSGGLPHQIRFGDIPYNMAIYYTGDGSRFREFEPINPQLGKLTTQEWPKGSGKQVSNYPGWIPGKMILIPAAWNPLSKPLPAPGSVASGSGGAKPGFPQGVIVPQNEGASVQDVFAKWGIPVPGTPGGAPPAATPGTSPSGSTVANDAGKLASLGQWLGTGYG